MKASMKRAFTLVELLVVVAIIILLLSIMVPAIDRSVRSAHVAVCGHNLTQNYKAWTLQAIEHGFQTRHRALTDASQPGGMPADWMNQLRPYLATTPEDIADPNALAASGWIGFTSPALAPNFDTFMCPEDDEPMIGLGGAIKVYRIERGRRIYLHHMPLELGMFTHATTGGNTSFKPGDKFTLWFEDIRPGGGDQDRDDFRVDCVVLEDGRVEAAFYQGTAGYHFDVEDENGNVALWDIGDKGAKNGSKLIVGGWASYAINEWAGQRADDSKAIFMLDYDLRTVATPGHDYWWQGEFLDTETGMPTFARHTDFTVNVMFRDGAVKQMSPWEIDPVDPVIQQQYWETNSSRWTNKQGVDDRTRWWNK